MKEKSSMIILPVEEEDIDFDAVLSRLSDWEDIKLGEILERENEDSTFTYDIPLCIDNREYTVTISHADIEIPDFFRAIHSFTDVDFELIEEAECGLVVEMDYSDHFLTSYHDQLRIMHAMVPKQVAVMDVPSEKIISGKWVKTVAESQVPPAPRYLFTVQAVSGDSDEVWLHTHGLKRCGLPELEILGSTKDMFNTHYSIIESMATRMIESEKALQAGDPIFLAWLTEDIALVSTIIYWKDALKYYPKIELGSLVERDDYHSKDSYAIMIYKEPEDVEAQKLTPVQALDEYIEQNAMFLVSDAETDRMRKLAQERIKYVEKVMQNSKSPVHVLLKIGLPIDKEFRDPDTDLSLQKEHIWFELKEIKKQLFKEVFVCELTQKPYYVKKMDVGSIGKYTVADITDWLIYKDGNQYTPDDVYLLDDE